MKRILLRLFKKKELIYRERSPSKRKWNARISRIQNFGWNVIHRLFGRKDYKKFVVICHSRTGSSLLLSLLDSHRDIVAYQERFGHIRKKDSEIIYKQTFPPKSMSKWIGFKLIYYHPNDSEDKRIWEWIKNDKEIKIIHQQRENLLRVFISFAIANKSQTWRIDEDYQRTAIDKRVTVDLEKLFAFIRKVENYIDNTNDMFKDHQMLEVKYKELTFDRDKTLNKVLDFLNLPSMKLKSPLLKQNPEEIKSLVVNYEEIHSALINTPYAFMLD